MLKSTNDITFLLELAAKLQEFGTQKEIVSVFDDGGYRELLMGHFFDLQLHKGRHGDDATDESGHNYEFKTVNIVDTSGKLRRNPGVTTCHHVNREIIARYRGLHAWIVGIFFVNEPIEIYELDPKFLNTTLDGWEKRLNEENITHLNNPKLSLKDVRENGILHYKNETLSKKYIDGRMARGIEVYKDTLDLNESRPKIEYLVKE